MSWLQRLVETYDACFGQPQFESNGDGLPPLSSLPQTTQLHIEIREDGTFANAELSELENTTMFVTEDSAGRSGIAPAANPLTEQLEYCAAGLGAYGGDATKHARFLQLLSQWADSEWAAPAVQAVRQYVQNGTLLKDLLRKHIVSEEGGTLAKVRVGKSPVVPLKLWVRWTIRTKDLPIHTWSDATLSQQWVKFDEDLVNAGNLCMLSGEVTRTTQKHPKRIRWGGDNAKLISANDNTGFTFLGRFADSGEAVTVSYAATQKAHNALRWLIKRQGARNEDQVVVAWSVHGVDAPPVLVDSEQFFSLNDGPKGDADSGTSEDARAYEGDAGQAYALRLKDAVRGYGNRIGDSDNVVVMALGSATPGRMAILYYRELTGSELLARLKQWHSQMAWPQNFGKNRHFIGAPAPRDIAEAAYGRRVDDKLRKATVERLLPCIVDARPLPRDLVEATVARASNRTGLEYWEFEKCLGIACSLYRGSHLKEFPTMSLDEMRTTRDYLYGRLLAVADNIESMALGLAKEKRETNAARLTQRFADHPYTTWRTLELQLRPYIARLKASRYAGALVLREQLIDKLMAGFPVVDGESTFLDNRRLLGEFLLGFHSQREALRSTKRSIGTSSENSEEVPGDDE